MDTAQPRKDRGQSDGIMDTDYKYYWDTTFGIKVSCFLNDTDEIITFLDGIWGPLSVKPHEWGCQDKGGFIISVPDKEFIYRFLPLE